jgi:hypothetical protein
MDPDDSGVLIDDQDRSAAARAARIAATLLPTARRRQHPQPGGGAAASGVASAAAAAAPNGREQEQEEEEQEDTSSERAAWTAAEVLSARARGVPAALQAVASDCVAATNAAPLLALLAASRLAAALARLPPASGAFAGLGGAPALPVGAGAAAAAAADDDDGDDKPDDSEREMRAEYHRARRVGSTAGARRTADAHHALVAALLSALAALLPAALDDSAEDEEDEEEEEEDQEEDTQHQSAMVVDVTPGPEPSDPAEAERARRRRRAAARREARVRLAADALLACATYGATEASPASLFWRALPSIDEAGAGGAGGGAAAAVVAAAGDEDDSEQEEEEEEEEQEAEKVGGGGSSGNDEGQALSRRVFGRAAALFSPWSDAACAEASARVLRALAGAAQAAADRAVGEAEGPRAAAGAAAAAAAATSPPPPAQLLLLFGAALPSYLLPDLRDVLFAQARHRLSLERGDPRPYLGPGAFARAVGARRAAWLAQAAFSPPAASSSGCSAPAPSPAARAAEVGALEQSGAVLLPLALAAAEDPSPAVQRHGAAALLSLSLCAAASAAAAAPPPTPVLAASRLAAAQRDVLLNASRRLVVGCEPGFARVALPAAAALAVAALLPPLPLSPSSGSSFASAPPTGAPDAYPPGLSGALGLRLPQPRAEPLHALWRELLAEAERAGHRPPLRRAFLACACDPLLPATGAFAARHLARLAPLLMEWSALPGARCEASRAAALAALAAVARDCCCCNAAAAAPDHAGVLWRRALAAARDEDARAFALGGLSEGPTAAEGTSTRTARAVVALARALRDNSGGGAKAAAAAEEALAAWRVAAARGGGDRCEQGAALARVLELLEEAAGGEEKK